MEDNGKIRYGRMEEKVDVLERNMTSVMNNHLPNLDEKIDKKFAELSEQITEIRVSMGKYIGIGIGALGLLQIVLKFFGK